LVLLKLLLKTISIKKSSKNLLKKQG